MAIELLPLLTDEGQPPSQGGDYTPTSTPQTTDVGVALDRFLNANDPNLYPYSLVAMTWDQTSWLTNAWSAFWNGVKGGGQWVGDSFAAFGVDIGRTWRETHDFVDTIITGIGWDTGQPTVIDRLTSIQAGVGGGCWCDTPFDLADPQWTLVATVTFDDAIHWGEQGHVYLVTATTVPTDFPVNPLLGEDVLYRFGWWAPRWGAHKGPRGFLDFEENLCHQNGQLMDGITIYLNRGGSCQLSAYRFVPA